MIKRLIILLYLFLWSHGLCQTDWTKHFDNPVMVKDTTIPGTWEWAAIGQPSCLFENDTFKMWYAAAGVSGIGDTILRGRISYAFSINGVDWIKQDPPVPVLDVGAPGTWDARWLDTPAIVRDDVEYKLFYYGDSGGGFVSAIGLATSPDGIIWTRYASNPVIEKSDSILDWDGLWIESPAVLYDAQQDTYRMWYTGVAWDTSMPCNQHIQIGLALSTDGKDWTKFGNNPVFQAGSPGSWDDAWVSVPAVRKVWQEFQMWYCGVSRSDWKNDDRIDTIRVGYAVSLDGISWTRYPGNPVLTNFDPPLDSGGPWAIDVVFDGDEYKMWYEAIGTSGNWICLATAPLSGIAESSYRRHTMLQVYPNPFSQTTYIKFQIPRAKFFTPLDNKYLTGQANSKSQMKIEIYNIAGRLIRSFLLSTNYDQLTTSLSWDGADDSGKKLPIGVYFIRLNIGKDNAIEKCLYLR